jgi:Uncharacterized conserved protein (DUF2190)
MAIFQVPAEFVYSELANADLSAKLHFLAKIDTTTGKIALAQAADAVFGVIIEANTANNPVTVQFGGIAKVEAGGAVTIGAKVRADANGNAVVATGLGNVFGIALAAADDGDIFPVALIPSYIAAS